MSNTEVENSWGRHPVSTSSPYREREGQRQRENALCENCQIHPQDHECTIRTMERVLGESKSQDPPGVTQVCLLCTTPVFIEGHPHWTFVNWVLKHAEWRCPFHRVFPPYCLCTLHYKVCGLWSQWSQFYTVFGPWKIIALETVQRCRASLNSMTHKSLWFRNNHPRRTSS